MRVLDPDAGIRFSVGIEPARPRRGEHVRWLFTLVNERDDAHVLTFRSSQLGDVVLQAAGVVCHAWSRGRVFAQLLSRRTIAAGESWTFSLDDELALEPGVYAVVATVACDPPLPPAYVELAVAP
jgi:Intracellular proteinase inhibitor